MKFPSIRNSSLCCFVTLLLLLKSPVYGQELALHDTTGNHPLKNNNNKPNKAAPALSAQKGKDKAADKISSCPDTARSCVKTFCYDFSDPDNLPENFCNTKSNFIHHGDIARFQVNNVNPFLYTTTIDGTIVEYKSTLPEGITSFMLPDLDYIAKLSGGWEIITVLPTGVGCDPAIHGKWFCRYLSSANNPATMYTMFKPRYDSLKAAENLDKTILMIAQEDYVTYDTIKARVDKSLNNFFGRQSADLNRALIYQNLLSRKDTIRKLYAALSDSCDMMIRILDSVDAEKKVAANKLYPDKKFYDELKKLVKEANDWATNGYLNVVNSIIGNYTRLNKENFMIRSSPIVAQKDEVVFSLSIAPKTGLAYNTPARSLKLDYPVWVKGGTKVIFSSGPVLSLGLMNQVFTYFDSTIVVSEPDSSYQQKLIRQQENALPDVGIAALMHIGWRCGYAFYPAATLGAMIDLSGKLRFLAGGSLIFGSRERLVLNAGLAYGAVEQLSADYTINRLYDPVNLPDSPPVYDKFKFGGYLGLTFSFGFTKEQNKIPSSGAQ